MENKTIYPFGQNGKLPSGYPIADDTITDRADIALSARQGLRLQEQINKFNLGETQTYGKILSINTYNQVRIDPITGEITEVSSTYANQFVEEYPIDLVDRDYLASYGYGGAQTGVYTFNYYDEEWNYLGGAYRNPGGQPATAVTMGSLVFPDSWESDLDNYKAQAKFLRIIGYHGLREATLYETWTIPQSILAQQVVPNEITIYASIIQSPMMISGINNNTEITTENVVSPWGIIWPETYTVTGTPTPVIAMLHGSEGYVCEGCLGYTSTGYLAQRNLFLASGFAVMDINGYGISTEADVHSKHWGCPLAVETLDKAFEFLKQNFNICDKIILYGLSMGGILAESYAKCFPGKVACVGLFAPNLFAYSMRYIAGDGSKELAWGYADHAEADADNYSHLTGYVPLSECMIVDDETGVIKKFDWTEYDSNNRTQIMSKKLVDFFPVPIRIWQGSVDTSVPLSNSQLLVSSLRRGNSTASIRICDGATHSIYTYAYVRNEAVSWFKRFIPSPSIS